MNKEMKDIMTNSILVFLIIALVYLGGVGTAKITKDMRAIDPISIEEDTIDVFDKKQIIATKEDIDYTNTTQGEDTLTKEEMLSKEPDCIYYDTIKVIEEDGIKWYTLDTIEMKREADSIDAYMKYWYEVLDTNSNGEIDDMEMLDCGGEVHDTIIEWLEE